MRRIYLIISSWWTTAACFSAIAGIYLIRSFGQAPYPAWVHDIFHTAIGITIYAIAVINLAATSIKAASKGLRRAGPDGDCIKSMDASSALPFLPGGKEFLSGWMRGRGFDPIEKDNAVYSSKGTYSFLPGCFMRLSLALLMTAFFISVNVRKSETVSIAEGETGGMLGYNVSLRKLDAALPPDFLQVGDVSTFRLDSAGADVLIDDEKARIGTGFASSVSGAYWKITDLGYLNGIRFDGKSYPVFLDVLPPGKKHTFQPDGKGPGIYISLAPERSYKKGLLIGNEYNLERPSYSVSIREEEPVPITAGHDAKVSGHSIGIGEARLYASVQAVEDPAYPFVVSGLMLFILSLVIMPARLFWYRRDIAAIVREDGGVLIGYGEEFFGKWAVLKFGGWLDSLEKDSGTQKEEPAPPQVIEE